MSAAQKKIFLDLLHTMILVLSVILIVYISVDSINDRNFWENHDYMVFQFWVCVAFIFDFFVELWLSQRKWEFIRHRWYFLLLSIPYLNIIPLTGWLVTEEELYFLRFIPLARGALALSIVIGYISKNKFLGLLVTLFFIRRKTVSTVVSPTIGMHSGGGAHRLLRSDATSILLQLSGAFCVVFFRPWA